MVMDAERINTIYRLYHEEKWSLRRISRELHMARKSIKKYLRSPGAYRLARKPRKSHGIPPGLSVEACEVRPASLEPAAGAPRCPRPGIDLMRASGISDNRAPIKARNPQPCPVKSAGGGGRVLYRDGFAPGAGRSACGDRGPTGDCLWGCGRRGRRRPGVDPRAARRSIEYQDLSPSSHADFLEDELAGGVPDRQGRVMG